MDIRRVNDYDDPNFSSRVLAQHGAFYVDGKPCSFEIIGSCTAEIDFDDFSRIDEIIDEFRFYAGHITMFYDARGELIACRPRVELIDVPVDLIQPSQFYIDERKLRAVSEFVRTGRDVIVPLMHWNGRLLALDGHTRLYCAVQKGIDRVRGYMEENEEIGFFAREAQRRGIYTVQDMHLLPHAEYEQKWNRFCDEYFAAKERTDEHDSHCTGSR